MTQIHTHKDTVTLPAPTHTPTHNHQSLAGHWYKQTTQKHSAKDQTGRKEFLSDLLWAGAVGEKDRQRFINTDGVYRR